MLCKKANFIFTLAIIVSSWIVQYTSTAFPADEHCGCCQQSDNVCWCFETSNDLGLYCDNSLICSGESQSYPYNLEVKYSYFRGSQTEKTGIISANIIISSPASQHYPEHTPDLQKPLLYTRYSQYRAPPKLFEKKLAKPFPKACFAHTHL